MRSVVWFRGKDLRVHDHAPLVEAARAGEVIPLFVLDPFFFARDDWEHRRQFLLQSLRSLAARLEQLGSRLLIAEGRSVDVVPRLAALWKADRVLAHRWTEPFGRERDKRIAAQCNLELWEGETLHTPESIRTKQGGVYGIFTPFYNAFLERVHIAKPIAAPRQLPPVPVTFDSAPIPTYAENPRLIAGGEKAAHARLEAFAKQTYDHDTLSVETTRLSADLKFGTLSARTVWHAIALPALRRQLVWRDFSHMLLWEHPRLLHEPYRQEWARFPWRDEGWDAWVEGRTGYPVVDAAARQLRAEGFVHNRARMIAASFLTKHLMIDYKRGEAHYMRYLVDGDWAQNNMNWQWVTGCGVDASPWFRIFNPTTQQAKFDPDGTYVKRWLGTERFTPIVDHTQARARFLATAKSVL